MKKICDMPIIRQFISYFFVGGIAAIAEWLTFAFFANLLEINYIVATILAFLIATTINYFLGKIWTFRNSRSYVNAQKKEITFIFIASGIGLLINMGLMYFFVSYLRLDTGFLKIFSKVMATGIVFFWNFFVRKFVIYRDK